MEILEIYNKHFMGIDWYAHIRFNDEYQTTEQFSIHQPQNDPPTDEEWTAVALGWWDAMHPPPPTMAVNFSVFGACGCQLHCLTIGDYITNMVNHPELYTRRLGEYLHVELDAYYQLIQVSESHRATILNSTVGQFLSYLQDLVAETPSRAADCVTTCVMLEMAV